MGRLAGHPNVVTVYDAGEEGGAPFIVEEYLEGGTVADLLASSPGRRLPVSERCGSPLMCALRWSTRTGVAWFIGTSSRRMFGWRLTVRRSLAILVLSRLCARPRAARSRDSRVRG